MNIFRLVFIFIFSFSVLGNTKQENLKIKHTTCEISPVSIYFGVDNELNKKGSFDEENKEMYEKFLQVLSQKGYILGDKETAGQLTLHGYISKVFKCSGDIGLFGEPKNCSSTGNYRASMEIGSISSMYVHTFAMGSLKGQSEIRSRYGETIFRLKEKDFYWLFSGFSKATEYLLDNIPNCEN